MTKPKEKPKEGMKWVPVSDLLNEEGQFGIRHFSGACVTHGRDWGPEAVTTIGANGKPHTEGCIECTVIQRIEAREESKGWKEVKDI